MLQYPSGHPFVTSRTEYQDSIEGRPENKIAIRVHFAELSPDFAVVDTGCPWCVLKREQAEVYDPDYQDDGIQGCVLKITGNSEKGILVRWPITLLAEEGKDITIESTVFIPNDDLDIPNFIGLDGLLCRIRFAVDPERNHFYFGAQSHTS